MSTRARQGLGWALIGLVMAVLAWLVLASGAGTTSAMVEMIADLVVLAGVTFVVTGLLVTAFALIRKPDPPA